MSREAGANPFGHACVTVSKQAMKNEPIEVMSAFGTYAEPSSSRDPLIKGLKKITGFNINLQNSHGTLREEKMRYFDADGLSGISVEVSEDKANQFKKIAQQQIEVEQQAIKELNQILKQKNIPQNGYTRLGLENHLAEIEGRAPRLQEFGFYINALFNTKASQTCKKTALDALANLEIFPPQLISDLYGSSFDYAFPIFSKFHLKPMKFIPAGDPSKHISKRTGHTHYFFEWTKNKLYIATPMSIFGENLQPNQNDFKLLKKTLNDLFKLRNQLMNKIENINNYQDIDAIKHHLTRIKLAIASFHVADLNQSSSILERNIAKAKFSLIQAEKFLYPEKFSASFLMRVISNFSSLNAIIGVTVLTVSLAIAGVSCIGLSIAASGLLYTSFHGFKFYQSEKAHRDRLSWLNVKSPQAFELNEKHSDVSTLDGYHYTQVF